MRRGDTERIIHTPRLVHLVLLLSAGCWVPPIQASDPPGIVATSPGPNAAGVDVDQPVIAATFSEDMAGEADQPDGTFQVRAWQGAIEVAVDGRLVVQEDVVAFEPDQPLVPGTTYVVSIGRGLRALDGEALAERHEWIFTTRTTRCVESTGAHGCYPSIQAAVDDSAPGDSIAVASDEYVENVVIQETVTLLGGFRPDFQERTPLEDGDDETGRSTIRPADPETAVVTVDGDEADTARVAPVIDRFVVTGGRSVSEGGGFRVTASDVQLRENVIIDNQGWGRGGGVYAHLGSPSLVRNRVASNTVAERDMANVIFGGGGVYLGWTTGELIGNQIEGNVASHGSGGGVLIVAGPLLRVTLSGNHIDENDAGDGKITATGGGVSIAGSLVYLVGGQITGNRALAGMGGGIDMGLSVVTLDGVRVEDNEAAAASGGSAIHVHGGVGLRLISSVVRGNRGGQAGVWLVEPSASLIVNCTFAENALAGVHSSSALIVANSIFYEETNAITATSPDEVSIVSNVFFRNTVDVFRDSDEEFAVEEENYLADPGLTDALRLGDDSPFIDAGKPSEFRLTVRLPDKPHTLSVALGADDVDIDGDSRVQAGTSGQARIDIGADEWSPAP